MVERRKYERFELVVPAKIETLARTAKKRKISLKTVNVCAGGAFFLTDAVLDEGTKVRVELLLSYNAQNAVRNLKGTRIRMLGTIMRSRDNGMAIRFSDDYVIAPLPAQAATRQ